MSTPLGSSRPFVEPLYQSSVYIQADLDSLERISSQESPGFIYSRDGHPNAVSLGSELAQLHGASWGLVTGTGMSALSLAILSQVNLGDRIVASNQLYGRTTGLLKTELMRFGISTEFIDTNDLAAVDLALQTPTRLLIVETISNPLLRVSDLPALSALAHTHSCKLLVDNTFASPILARPLEQGADLVMESLTKIIGGHHDVTLGFLAGGDASEASRLASLQSIWGFSANPFDCWLVSRSLETLSLRVHASSINAHYLAHWLSEQPGVSRVIYPSLSTHPDSTLAPRILPTGNGFMLAFELAEPGREAVNRFMQRCPKIPFSPSLGGAVTTCSYPWSTSHRHESTESKMQQGISESLIRLSVGIEPLTSIQNELLKGLGA
jgi:cystathionine beta-lyase/cystathionine gamma-synthase